MQTSLPRAGQESARKLCHLADSCVSSCADIDALSQLVMSSLDKNTGVTLPPLDGAATTEEGTGECSQDCS